MKPSGAQGEEVWKEGGGEGGREGGYETIVVE